MKLEIVDNRVILRLDVKEQSAASAAASAAEATAAAIRAEEAADRAEGVDPGTGEPIENGTDGREVELQKSATHIQWRYVGELVWIDLVPLIELEGEEGYTPVKGTDYFDGEDGLTPTIGVNGNWYVGDVDTGTKAQGENGLDGKEVQLQKSATHIQWKYTTDVDWINLVPLSELEAGGSSADASTSVKGISKLSVAPVSLTDPIAVGTNDPRMDNARTPVSHNHPQSEITGLVTDLGTKVDKVAGETLTPEKFTTEEKSKLAGLESSKFKGTYISLSALNTALPTSSEGDYAHVDSGLGGNIELYVWDSSDSIWRIAEGESTEETAASIKIKYESNPDTNAFTDSDKTNLGANTLKRSYPQIDETKLSGIDNNANNYSHPNHTGDVTSTGDGATVIEPNVVTESKLHLDVRTKLNAEGSGYTPAVERESNTVLFDQDYIIGNAAPRTGNVLFDFTGAKLGASTIMIHQDALAFTLPAESVVLSGTISDTVTNYIYFLLVNKTIGSEKVHITISQELI